MNGAALLIVYRPQQMLDARATAERWRRHCREAGIGEIHLVAALTHGNDEFECFGFDAGLDFPPHNVERHAGGALPNHAVDVRPFHPLENKVWEFADFAQAYLSREYATRRVYRGVVPGWDNTARTGPARICWSATRQRTTSTGSTRHRTSPSRSARRPNGWSSSMPGTNGPKAATSSPMAYGRGYLEATRRVKAGHASAGPGWEASSLTCAPPPAPNGQTQPAVDVASAPPRVDLSTRVAVRTARALTRYPGLYNAARSVYRSTLKRSHE